MGGSPTGAGNLHRDGMTTRATELRQAAYPALDGLRCYAVLLVFLVHLLGALLTEYYRIP